MFGAPLKSLAGYLPPMSTHDFKLLDEIRNSSGSSNIQESDALCEAPKYTDFLHLPHGIKGYFDYDQALQCAREKNKPLFIDFTGHGCVNCREMEARVWSDPEVLKILKNDYIVVALYVDDKTTLSEADWYTSTYDEKVKKTIGKQNADFQITAYNNNAQPFYLLLDNEENLMVQPNAYDLNVRNFINFLEEGKRKFKGE
jgi:thiol:disulfide interchange protein DsbD